MYIQKELPGFRVSPTALWPSSGFSENSFRRDETLELFIKGVLGPEYDEELSSIYTTEEVYDLFCRFCKSDLSFVEKQDGLYPDNAYDANLLEYMRTFIVPFYEKRNHASLAKVIEYPWDFSDDVVVMNGAFNGVPHPGWIEALTLVKREFPDKRLVVGIGSNFEIENAKLQVPVGNTKWRASLLANTGLIDGIFSTRDTIFYFGSAYEYPEEKNWLNGPENRSEESYYRWWSSVYGRSSDRPPFAVVTNGERETERKLAFLNPDRTRVFDLSQQPRIFADFHSQNVERWGSYTPEYVMECWEELRKKYL